MPKTTAAQRGAKLLDRVRPDWYMQVQPGNLDLADTEQCVLGQLYGNYRIGVWHFTPRFLDTVLYGFNLNRNLTWYWPGKREGDFSKLTEAWREEIAMRRVRALAGNVTKEEVFA